jgi:hypothetical protein
LRYVIANRTVDELCNLALFKPEKGIPTNETILEFGLKRGAAMAEKARRRKRSEGRRAVYIWKLRQGWLLPCDEVVVRKGRPKAPKKERAE